jgi:DNA-directed RNA polymerase specialized sigma24 family protein
MGAHLSGHDREDALSYLVATTWEASVRFDPSRSSSFSKFSYQLCRRRTIDFIRQRNGRTRWKFADSVYERDRPVVLDIDDPSGRGLDGLERPGLLDSGSGGNPDLARALERGRSLLARSSFPPGESALD